MPGPRSGPESRSDGHFVQHFPPSVDALPGARHDFSQWLGARGMAPDLRDELATAYSELTANAIGTTADAALSVQVRAWCDGTEIVFEVVNPSPDATRPSRRWDRVDALRAGGRGLQIVQAFVDRVEADHDEKGRLIVRCRRSIAARV